MKWHIIITDEKSFELAVCIISKLKSDKKNNVSVFLTGRGVLLVNNSKFLSLLDKLDRCVACEFSLEKYGVEKRSELIKYNIDIGGQFQNAELVSISNACICI